MASESHPRYSERYFYLSPLYSTPGWYFRVRGGKSKGPFYRKEDAVKAAGQFAHSCCEEGDRGGRMV
jgi:hypothetical protein